MKAIKVKINWSESNELNNLGECSFFIFEAVAKAVAEEKKFGYDKTNVTVKFDDGSEYTARLDLGDVKTFKDHAKSLIEWFESREEGCKTAEIYRSNYEFLKQVEF